MEPFRRRTYTLKTLWQDFRATMSRRAAIRQAMRGGRVPEIFRERLMLVVTEVNGCRYCRTFHNREALKAGLSQDELHAFSQGLIPEDAPEEQHAALLYARYWAENDARPDPEATRQLVGRYGQETAEDILTVLGMIRMGNLLGNTWDYLLYRLSFGRLGLLESEAGDSV
ncbi:MAG: carboxymuconolactone decarboxylase family protein [Chloroflexota bacterium]|nr:carboxymuconolactone decarboxylase family protein [Chloroflexota bacterium]